MGSQCPDTQTLQDNSASAVAKMKSLFLVGFLLTLMIGDIVGPGGDFTGGDDGNGDTGKDWFANDEVHFIKDSGVQRRARQGRQSVLGCMMGCTRELRPVRGSREAMRGCLLTNVPLTLRDAEPRSRG